MYFLGAAELLSVEILILILHLRLRSLFLEAILYQSGAHCLTTVRRQSISWPLFKVPLK